MILNSHQISIYGYKKLQHRFDPIIIISFLFPFTTLQDNPGYCSYPINWYSSVAQIENLQLLIRLSVRVPLPIVSVLLILIFFRPSSTIHIYNTITILLLEATTNQSTINRNTGQIPRKIVNAPLSIGNEENIGVARMDPRGEEENHDIIINKFQIVPIIILRRYYNIENHCGRWYHSNRPIDQTDRFATSHQSSNKDSERIFFFLLSTKLSIRLYFLLKFRAVYYLQEK